jgi:hypothetical protein
MTGGCEQAFIDVRAILVKVAGRIFMPGVRLGIPGKAMMAGLLFEAIAGLKMETGRNCY